MRLQLGPRRLTKLQAGRQLVTPTARIQLLSERSFKAPRTCSLEALGAAVGDPGQQLLGGQAEDDVPQLGPRKATPVAHLRGRASSYRARAGEKK